MRQVYEIAGQSRWASSQADYLSGRIALKNPSFSRQADPAGSRRWVEGFGRGRRFFTRLGVRPVLVAGALKLDVDVAGEGAGSGVFMMAVAG